MSISSGTLITSLAHNQFIHLYGQRGARLDRDQSVYSSTVKSRSLLVRHFSPLLFGAPETHLRALENIWVDRLVHVDSWIQFNKKLIAEWKEITIIVMLLYACMCVWAYQSCRPLFSSTQMWHFCPFQVLTVVATWSKIGLSPRSRATYPL
jgi:hypothetical protein